MAESDVVLKLIADLYATSLVKDQNLNEMNEQIKTLSASVEKDETPVSSHGIVDSFVGVTIGNGTVGLGSDSLIVDFNNGEVRGTFEDLSEAAAIFVREVRNMLPSGRGNGEPGEGEL